MREEYNDQEYLGSFNQSVTMIVCDPCYKRDYSTGPSLFNRIEVVAGSWDAFTYYFGGRVSRLEAKLHGSHSSKYEVLVEDCSVDSGQFGFYDDTIFPYYDERDHEDKDKFYGKCCDITLSKLQAGIIDDKGVVSSSGFGDGSYKVTVGKNTFDKINSITVEFISEEEY